jgi:hypothetical protein
MWPYVQWVNLRCSTGKKCCMNMDRLKCAYQANSILEIKGKDVMMYCENVRDVQ